MQLSAPLKHKSFSLIIPFHNRGAMFPRLAESIKSQINDNWEVIVCDDASTENIDLVKVLCITNGFKYHRLIENRGPAGARNEGARIAEGQYLVFIDSDDYILPGFINRYEVELIGKSFALGWCGIELASNSTNQNTDVWLKDKAILELDTVMNGIYVGTNCGFFCSAYFFNRIRGFDETLRHAEDTDFLIRAAYHSPFIKVINSHLVAVDKNMLGRVTFNFKEKVKAYEKIIFKNKCYLKSHPLIEVKFKYKLAWAYLHSHDKKNAITLFKSVLIRRFHYPTLFLFASTFFLGTAITCKVHFFISNLKKRISLSVV
jgi:glycosyltransferase involved in cell wall biosynthesis